MSNWEQGEALLTGERSVLELIARGAPLSQVLAQTCRVIEQQSDACCSILLLNPKTRTLRLGAAPSLPETLTWALDGIPAGSSTGPCATAVRQSEPVIIADIAAEPWWSPFRQLALSHGLRACWSTPISSSSQAILGTFAMFYREPRSLTSRDQQLIDCATRLAGIAIERYQADEERFQLLDRERQARQKAEAAERRYRNLLEALDVTVWEADPTTLQFTFVSPRAVDVLGYPVEQWLTEPDFWSRHMQPEDRERTLTRCRAAAAEDRDCQLEYRMVGADGRVVWFLNKVSVLREAEDGAQNLLGVMIDITERVRIEEALRESELRYRELFENANDIVFTLDLAGNFTSVNKAGERITGYRRLEAARMNIAQVVAPEYRELAWQMIQCKLAGASRTTYELEIVAKDSRRVSLEVSTRLIEFGGKPVAVQGIARDTTERKQLQAQLLQAQKMEAIGRLAGGVAHDFNNLLTVIRGHSEILLKRLSPGERLRFNAQEVQEAADRAASLTQQLLAFSRKQVLQPKILDLNAIVTGMEKMLHRLLGEDIELVAALDPGLGRSKADPGQIEQVLLNLAVNGRDAMPQGGKLTIRTANLDLDEPFAHRYPTWAPGRYVLLSVTDTGSGMDKQTQARIFEPFFTTKEQGKGTGLGLATVYGIVRQSGGHIRIHSELGKGTTFQVYLPQVEEADPEFAPGPDSLGSCRGSETVLVVEDETGVRKLVQEFLESHGYLVLEARDGREALQIAERYQGPIHLLVTDVVLPQVSGSELAQQLARLRSNLRVLYLSGYTDDALVNYGVSDRASGFLQKPFTLDDLSHKVREALDEQKERDPAAQTNMASVEF